MEKLFHLNNPKHDLRMLLCEIGPLRAIFDYFQLGEIANFLGKEYIFYETPTSQPIPRFSRRTKDIYHQLASEHNCKINFQTFENLSDGWDYLIATIEQGFLNIIYLDAYYLPFTPLYQIKHQHHCVCVNGYNKQEGCIYIYDTAYKQLNKKIPKEDIDAAWQVYQYKAITVPKNQKLIDVDKESFFMAMKNNVNNLTNPIQNEIYLDNSYVKKALQPGKEYHLGFAAMKYLYNIISEFNKVISSDDLKYDLFFTISCIAEQTELHSLFLDNMGQKFDISISDLAKDIKHSAQEWAIVKNMLIKSTYKDAERMLQRAASKVLGIIQKDKDYVSIIEKILY